MTENRRQCGFALRNCVIINQPISYIFTPTFTEKLQIMLKTLYDKLWESHVVHTEEDGTALLYIDRHLLHEVTSPQAFEGLKLAGRQPWRASANLVVADHNVPTTNRAGGIEDPVTPKHLA